MSEIEKLIDAAESMTPDEIHRHPMAAVDKLRALARELRAARAGVVAEEPEWAVEYGVRGDVDSPMVSREAAEYAIERMAKAPRGYRITRTLVERRVSPWVPVEN